MLDLAWIAPGDELVFGCCLPPRRLGLQRRRWRLIWEVSLRSRTERKGNGLIYVGGRGKRLLSGVGVR